MYLLATLLCQDYVSPVTGTLSSLHNKISCACMEAGKKLNHTVEYLETLENSIHSSNEFHKH